MAAPAEQTSHGSFPETLSAAFRALPIPVIGRVEAGEFRLDVRCLEDENTFVEQLPRLSF